MRRLDRRDFMLGLGWVATTDMLLCVNAVLINQVHPKAAADGVKINAEYVITCEWPVTLDADVDLHTIVPDGKDGQDVFYKEREFQGVSLDTDCKGFVDTHHQQADGSAEIDLTAKEMTTIRGIIVGRYDVGAHLFSFHRDGQQVAKTARDCDVKAHIEVTQLNPKTKIVFAKDVVLTHVGQCINVVSFDIDRDGAINFADAPLAPVTDHVYDKGASE